MSFGMDTTDGFGLPDPVEIALPKGCIACRGKIDRIDRRPAAHEWEVWDYKTGSTWGFTGSDYTAGGTQLQHALYAIAAEKFLRRSADPKAKVVATGYLFPTEKGRGEVFRRDPRRIKEALMVIDVILDLIREGIFLGREDQCRFCDYLEICGSGVRDRRKALESANDPAMQRVVEVLGHA